jgi:hypothetical protein
VAEASSSGGGDAIYVFGSNLVGQLGLGLGHPSVAHPRRLPLSGHIKTLSCGGYHTLALEESGALWGWGLNLNSQLALERFEPIAWTPARAGCHSPAPRRARAHSSHTPQTPPGPPLGNHPPPTHRSPAGGCSGAMPASVCSPRSVVASVAASVAASRPASVAAAGEQAACACDPAAAMPPV